MKCVTKNNVKSNVVFMCYVALGIALYVVVSMMIKIPIGIGHLALDLGYIVFAVYCMKFGALAGAIVGGAGCVLVSLLSSGWFPLGWLLGNIAIGIICGLAYKKSSKVCFSNIIITIAAVIFGVGVIKTVVECSMFSIPYAVKIPKNMIAAAMDAVVMVIGLIVSNKITLKNKKQYQTAQTPMTK